MTEQEFIKVNTLFNTIIKPKDLNDDFNIIDHNNILNRIYEKINGQIKDDLLGIIIIFNKHIIEEQYNSVQIMKEYILKNY
jgi:hypothetical protein